MKHSYIMLHIVMMFLAVIFLSFIPDLNHQFFGDWLCQGCIAVMDTHGAYHNSGCLYLPGAHNPTWHWGFRHHIWFWMGLIIFVYNAVLVINKIIFD